MNFLTRSSDNIKNSFVIGLDCSTTAIKAVVFDKTGNTIARASEPIPLHSPKPNYYEQNPDDWWQSTQVVLRKITREVNPDFISALAISNQRETFVALNKSGDKLRPAIIWLDERCRSEVKSFSKKIGADKLHRITGKPADYAPVVYRLAWMKKYEPKLFKEISIICDVQSYLVWKLTNSFKTSWASADPLGMFDIKAKKWSKVIIKALGIKEEQLPALFAPGKILGNITKEVSMLTGLSRNTTIVAGGGDGQSAGLGSNVMNPKTAYLNLGTAVVAGVFGKDKLTHKSFRTMTAVAEDGYYYECSLRGGTFSIDWFIKNILKIDTLKQPDIYKILEKEGESVSAGSGGLLFLPYISGAMNPYWDMEARGAFIGLSSSHSRGHMYRSILEGIALEQLFALNSVEKALGSKIYKLAAIGGGAKSEFWCQILADVTGKNIYLPVNQEASSLGAAISAAIGAGLYNSFKTAAREMSMIEKIIKPNKANHKKYIRIFSSYRKIYPQLKKITIED